MKRLNRRNLMAGSGAFAGLGLIGVPALAVDVAALHKAPALGEMTMGPDDAKVTVIEYASATCPHCAAFYKDTFGALKTEYIDTGKIRFVLREFPHDDAALAAFMLARCAPKEKYFALVDIFFTTQPQWTQSPRDGLLNIAKQAGFSEESFNKCLNDQALAKSILEIRSTAEGFGVNSIPTFFINGQMIKGEQKIEDLKKMIDPLLG
jgi:protein-disulfide isomerase